MRKVCISLATVILVILGTNLAIAQYKQTNLVADERGHAVYTCTGVSTVYRPHGKPLPIAVTIPAAPTCPLAYSVRPPGWLPIPLRNSLFQRTEIHSRAIHFGHQGRNDVRGNPEVDRDHAITVIRGREKKSW